MEDKKDKLLKVVDESQKTASAIEKNAIRVVRDTRFVKDMGENMKDFVGLLPAGELSIDELDPLIETWEGIRDEGTRFLRAMEPTFDNFFAVASGTAVTITSVYHTYSLGPQTEGAIYGKIDDAIYEKVTKQFYRLLDKDTLAAEVKDNFIRLRLDERSGSIRSALELFDDAKAALETPNTSEDSPVHIMIPLRECINRVVERLLQRRQDQEPARKMQDKICSIGAQCGRSGLTSDHFSRLGIDGDSLLNELSGTKQTAIPRQGLVELFERGALFIKALLSSIDEKKLRSHA